MLSLKPGDMVCTCRYEHKQIVRIENESEVRGNTALIPWVVGLASLKIAYEIQENLKKVHGEVIEDRIVYFEDDTFCSAVACLDPLGSACLEGHKELPLV